MLAGAVAGVKHISNPIDLAKRVMTDSQHVLLIGEGAEQFATEQGFKLVDKKYFHTDQRWEQWQSALVKEQQIIKNNTQEI